MCIRPLGSELHWLNIKKKYLYKICHVFKNKEGLAQLRTSHQLHCLEPAVLHTFCSFCAYCTQEREKKGCFRMASVTDYHSTHIPQKLHIGSFSLESTFLRQ